ncbi:mycofactocin-associated electron transfer flavoprotein beta subunit [Amycolatopsis antarctica]|nr:mycofactocin-associated electron transfer flavoprotein beta subunit [Amycolatopsis antarctica]
MSPPVIVAALRWVDLSPRVDPLTGAVHTGTPTSGLTAADECALEHALRLAEAMDGDCVAVTAGPEAADTVLRRALAAGASSAWRAPLAESALDDGRRAATALAGLVRAHCGEPSYVLCGDHSADRGTGATPGFLAAMLGLPQALGVLHLDWDQGRVVAQRRLDGGRRERLALAPPAVCSVEPANVRLRRAPLPAVLAARHAELGLTGSEPSTPDRVRTVGTHAFRPRTRRVPAPVGENPNARLLALTGALVEREPPRLTYPADANAAADELLAFLRQHGYLT